MVQYTDTHCHLTLPQFDIDRSEVILRAIDMGLYKLLIPGIDLDSSIAAINLCASYPGILYTAIGIHPNTENGFSNETLRSVKSLVKKKCVVAIGEIGLDYFRTGNTKQAQKVLFRQFLEIAAEFRLPVCIHNREASDDIIAIIEKWIEHHPEINSDTKIKGVFHSFFGNLQLAKKVTEMGFLLGISGPITYPKNLELTKTINEIGIDHLLVETDAPYLAPQEFRGKRNLPEYVQQVVEKLSSIFNLPEDEVRRKTNQNASRLFHWE